MLGRLKIMQSFDGQILNLPPIFNIRIVSNINYLNEDGSVWGTDRVRPLAAKASGWVSKTVRRQDPIRVAIIPRFRNTVGLRGWVRLQPGAKPFAPIHERRIRPDCRCNAAADVSYFETEQRPALSGYPISPCGLSLEA
jgi:hypothetical protein